MISKKGVLEPFSRDRLFVALYNSCRHRPDALGDATALAQIVTSQILRKQKDGIISRDDIVLAAHLALKRFDKVAATFFSAYHPILQG